MQLGGTINDKKKTVRPTSWTPARKNQLKRLANNRKGVSQSRLARKLGVSHVIIFYQTTPRNSENQAEKAKSHVFAMKNILHMMAQIFKETTATT